MINLIHKMFLLKMFEVVYLLPPRICISNDPFIITHPFNFCADCILSTLAATQTLRHGPIKIPKIKIHLFIYSLIIYCIKINFTRTLLAFKYFSKTILSRDFFKSRRTFQHTRCVIKRFP